MKLCFRNACLQQLILQHNVSLGCNSLITIGFICNKCDLNVFSPVWNDFFALHSLVATF